ncbi:growth factor receptor domain-containing protein [Sistotremastrum niveocremeum HHB9708]|uniref:Growth factor receptor domain-containing protein n=1 Tax=Sistotremastrum niveocremeum HHB9708 TaxID=1314777 RepID=A0A165AC60_9AGAM|nr:growth factor receptor domain-containing protein [Sistotremastrum niveocremeum HHB9708]
MFYSISLAIALSTITPALAQSLNNVTVVCVAGQCLEGYTNTSLGEILTAPSSPSVLLLPGQYSTSTSPQLLHNMLTSSQASLAPQAGFGNASRSSSTIPLPLSIQMQPGVVAYTDSLYGGQGFFSSISESPASLNGTLKPLNGASLSISSNTWAALEVGSGSTLIVWSSIPDFSQLPPTASSGSFSLLDIQSGACSPPCAGAGVCSLSGTCTCPTGFTGQSCETCADGFFGPDCLPCPADCETCDSGPTGTGKCLVPAVANAPSTCNCLNGVCGSNGSCTCNAGWTAASNGTACAACAKGFFLSSSGNCQVCSIGCTECSDGSGDCITCANNFTADANDRTKCDPVLPNSANGGTCPSGSFASGNTSNTACTACSPVCGTCTGPTSNECITCASGSYLLNGNCVKADQNGVCEGTNLIANNNNGECDSCPSKCTTCNLPQFAVNTQIAQAQCTGCVPGFVLSNGQCVASCPSGTFLNPQDNLTCIACSSSCGTCAGAADFCLSCHNNQLASNGQCVTSCPTDSFSSNGSCLPCHADCGSCSGSAFNQCSTCTSARPVLTSGRCLPTCSQNQFFDITSSSCQTCDSTCSSCSGTGPNNCLACSSASQVLRAGKCVEAPCAGNSTVVAGLGACLSEFVVVPTSSSGTTLAPLPSFTGITIPTTPVVTTSSHLQWWQILLMTLGCAFIALMALMCLRRRARKKRAQQTAIFAQTLDQRQVWRRRFARFGALFKKFRRDPNAANRGNMIQKALLLPEASGHMAPHDPEMGRYDQEHEMEKLSAVSAPRSGSRRGAPSPQPSLDDQSYHSREPSWVEHDGHGGGRLTIPSLYSHITGEPRRGPEPRTTVKNAQAAPALTSRFSDSTIATADIYRQYGAPRSRETIPPVPPMPETEAQQYASASITVLEPQRVGLGTQPQQGVHWLTPSHTGSSGASRNPFRQY